MQSLPLALSALGSYAQFLLYILVPNSDDPVKLDKLPVSPHTGRVCNPHDPKNWTTAEHACRCAVAWGSAYGVAFSFQKSDPFFFVDIDKAYDGGAWSPISQLIVSLFPGAAIEISQSLRGLHIIGRGEIELHGKKNKEFGLELYTSRRFVALTGTAAQGDANLDCTEALNALVAGYFSGGNTQTWDGAETLNSGPVAHWRGPLDDGELIRRALASKSAASQFGQRASFRDLWEANAEALGVTYPDRYGKGRAYDSSDGDAALAAHLSFWTGRDGERIEALMWQSGLVRDKWGRKDYLPRTIMSVLAHEGDVLIDKPHVTPQTVSIIAPSVPQTPQTVLENAPSVPPQPSLVDYETFLGIEQQRSLFSGCVYVQDRHVVLIPGGVLLKPDQFRAAYGGHTFTLDASNQRITKNAWEAFTESQVLRPPRAHTTCFRPDQSPALITNRAGRAQVNTYWAPEVKRVIGDPLPFLIHLTKLFPDSRDREIILSYMAACVQYKGRKFQWAPLIQGVEGNGKTYLSACLAEAIGAHYVHWVSPLTLLSRFNAWLDQKLFFAVEELVPKDRVLDSNDLSWINERLKLLITGGRGIEIEGKGADQVSKEFCANLMITTNYIDVIRKTPDNARRFAFLITAQQKYVDIERAGMAGSYFPNLERWFREQDGFAIVTELLHTYPIPAEFNPAIALHRAPDTSSVGVVIKESRSNIEQQIMEAVEQGVPGFLGGWVSTIMLDRFLAEATRNSGRLPHTKRKEILQNLGYILHPGLHDGRTNNPVMPDGRKPQLYILASHPDRLLTGPGDIAKTYSDAQVIK